MSFLLGVIVVAMLMVVLMWLWAWYLDRRLRQDSVQDLAGLLALCDELEAKAKAGEIQGAITDAKITSLDPEAVGRVLKNPHRCKEDVP